MRKLMWFTLGFGGITGLGMFLTDPLQYLILAFLCLTLGVFFRILSPSWGRVVLMAMAGGTVGALWLFAYGQVYLAPLKTLDENPQNLVIEAADYPVETQMGQTADGNVTLAGRTYKIRFYLDRGETVSPGDQIYGTFSLAFTPEMDNAYYPGLGIFLLGYPVGEPMVVPGEALSWQYFPAQLRRSAMDILASLFPSDTAAFAQGLLLGQTENLSAGTDRVLEQSGIRHVVAVSGLHVSILFGMVHLLTRRKRWLTALLGIPVLLLFSAVAGFSPSIVRACAMQVLMILAMLWEREYDPPTALAFGAGILLLWNPYTITSVSFQLSVGSMAGIFLVSGKIRGYLMDKKRLGRWNRKTLPGRLAAWGAASFSVTLGAMLLTTPMCAYYFGTVSLVSPVSNILLLWLVTWIFYGIIVCVLLGGFLAPVAGLLAQAVSWGIRIVLGAAKVLGNLPYATIRTENVYLMGFLVFAYGLVLLFLFLRPRKPRLLCVCLAIGLVSSIFFSTMERFTDSYRVTVLDVGQGQCVLIQCGGDCFVVDCGSQSGSQTGEWAADALKDQGVSRISGLILTHYDFDHTSGARELMELVETDTLYLPHTPEADRTLAQGAEQVYWISTLLELPCGTGKITILPGEKDSTGNENSLCILFQAENCDILITGDRNQEGEAYLLEQIDLPRLDVLIVGHHGADSSTGLALLEKTRPATAVISVGAENGYGHPQPEVLQRLELFGCRVLRTDQNGTIVLRG